MVYESIPHFLKKLDWRSVIIFNFGNNLVFLIYVKRKLLNGLNYLFCITFIPKTFDSDHYINLSFIKLNPVWKE